MERRSGRQLVCTENTSTAAKVKRGESCWGDSGPRPEARKEERDKRKVAKVTPDFARAVGKQKIAPMRVGTGVLNAVDEDKGDISEEVHEDEDELHAWCLLEESENEQWEEVICNKSKLKLKKLPVSRAEF